MNSVDWQEPPDVTLSRIKKRDTLVKEASVADNVIMWAIISYAFAILSPVFLFVLIVNCIRWLAGKEMEW